MPNIRGLNSENDSSLKSSRVLKYLVPFPKSAIKGVIFNHLPLLGVYSVHWCLMHHMYPTNPSLAVGTVLIFIFPKNGALLISKDIIPYFQKLLIFNLASNHGESYMCLLFTCPLLPETCILSALETILPQEKYVMGLVADRTLNLMQLSSDHGPSYPCKSLGLVF